MKSEKNGLTFGEKFKPHRCYSSRPDLCGGVCWYQGKTYCSDYVLQCQIDYAGHVFCADLKPKDTNKQLSLFGD